MSENNVCKHGIYIKLFLCWLCIIDKWWENNKEK